MKLTSLYLLGGQECYPTDKDTRHSYLSVYDELFKQFQYSNINIFEVGYFIGGSCKLWIDYFPNAQVRSIDNLSEVPDELKAQCRQPLESRIRLDLISINELTERYFDDFKPTIVIDDGSHLIQDQIKLVQITYPVLVPGGLIIIEDIQNMEYVEEFKKLGYGFEIHDRRNVKGCEDDILIIFRK
jgi:hypothetical protein